MPDHPDPLHSIVRRLAASHAWLIGRCADGPDFTGFPQRDGVELMPPGTMRVHLDSLAGCAAAAAGEAGVSLSFPEAKAPVTALDAGLSALALYLVVTHARMSDGSRAPWALDAAPAYRAALVLLNAARGMTPQERESALCRFELPAVVAWGPDWLRQVAPVLRERLPKLEVLSAARHCLLTAGLSEKLWDYVGPQVGRYRNLFGISLAREVAIRLALRIV